MGMASCLPRNSILAENALNEGITATIRKAAKPPAFTRPPDRMGEKGSGALPCACGSQMWNGNTPSLIKPAIPMVMNATIAAVGSPAACWRTLWISNEPNRP